MLEMLKIFVEERLANLAFRLFDRDGNDCFGYQMFVDLMEENLTPNLKKIVIKEKAAWPMRHLITKKQSRR